MTTRSTVFALACLAGIVVAACGSSAGATGSGGAAASGGATASGGAPASAGIQAALTAGSASSADVCGLLSEADVTAITSYGVASRTPGPVMGVFAAGCEWTLDGGSDGAPAQLTVGVLAPGGADAWARNFAPFMDEPGRSTLQGLGDGAFTEPPDALVFASGDALVSLQYLDGESGAARLEAIARRILGNLPAE